MFPILVGITVFAFILLRSFPNSVLAADFISVNQATSTVPYPVLLQQASAKLGLNYPIPVQYFYFLQNFLTGSWGYVNAPITGPTVQDIFLLLPNTMQLLIFTLLLTLGVSIPLGTYLGSRPHTVASHTGMIFSLVGFAMPQFFFGLILLLLFGEGIGHWFGAVFPLFGVYTLPNGPPPWLLNPSTGLITSVPTHMVFFDALIHLDFSLAFSVFMHLVLPVLTLSYSLLATIVIYLRAGMIDSSGQEYIRAAIAKGVQKNELIKIHMRKNAMLPTITTAGFFLTYLLGGIIVVESLFSYHGIGWFIAQAVVNMQVYGIVYTGIIFGIMLMLINFVVDVLYVLMDPRIRY